MISFDSEMRCHYKYESAHNKQPYLMKGDLYLFPAACGSTVTVTTTQEQLSYLYTLDGYVIMIYTLDGYVIVIYTLDD